MIKIMTCTQTDLFLIRIIVINNNNIDILAISVRSFIHLWTVSWWFPLYFIVKLLWTGPLPAQYIKLYSGKEVKDSVQELFWIIWISAWLARRCFAATEGGLKIVNNVWDSQPSPAVRFLFMRSVFHKWTESSALWRLVSLFADWLRCPHLLHKEWAAVRRVYLHLTLTSAGSVHRVKQLGICTAITLHL